MDCRILDPSNKKKLLLIHFNYFLQHIKIIMIKGLNTITIQQNCIKTKKRQRGKGTMLFLTYAETPISRKSWNTCTDIRRSTGVDAAGTLGDITCMWTSQTMIHYMVNSCKSDMHMYRRLKLKLFLKKKSSEDDENWEKTEYCRIF